MNVGLIAMAAKPYHIGHDMLIRLAAKQNDQVYVFVSTSDRIKKNEFPIYGQKMLIIWSKYIEKTLPGNVVCNYYKNPLTGLYEFLIDQNNDRANDVFNLYSDNTDSKNNFPESSLVKYTDYLYNNNQLNVVGVDRLTTRLISGTKMREFLKNNDKESFMNNLSDELKPNVNDIWSVLKS